MIYFILFSAFFGLLLRAIASERDADKKFWLTMGIVFGPFALPFVFFSKAIPASHESSDDHDSEPSQVKKPDKKTRMKK